MDVLDLLIGDHNRVKGFFSKFGRAEEDGDTDVMAAVAAKILEELDVHTRIEEETFYPAIHEASEELKAIVDEGIQEHHLAKVLMDEIRGLDAANDAWVAKMKVLIESVEHHVEEEEGEMFPQVRKAVDDEQRQVLGARMEDRKATLGAPKPSDNEGATKTELLEKAREQEIPGRSSMSKDELSASVDGR